MGQTIPVLLVTPCPRGAVVFQVRRGAGPSKGETMKGGRGSPAAGLVSGPQTDLEACAHAERLSAHWSPRSNHLSEHTVLKCARPRHALPGYWPQAVIYFLAYAFRHAARNSTSS